MKAMIMAAGVGSRLKPWTDSHPKALVPVDGVPMIRRVLQKMKESGVDGVVINVHHFGHQIINYLQSDDLGLDIHISDEREKLLDTGGGIAKASDMLLKWNDSVIFHNVDILSNCNLAAAMAAHNASGRDITLITSRRESSRKLLFDAAGNLQGWHNLNTDEFRPTGADLKATLLSGVVTEEAFSGIYIMNESAIKALTEYQRMHGEKFPIMDFFLSLVGTNTLSIGMLHSDDLQILDIGKPDALASASRFLKRLK